jgi:hypothetical protein
MVTGARASRRTTGLTGILLLVSLAAAGAGLLLPSRTLLAADACTWLGDDLPLPLPARSREDIEFKTAVERQYLVFNLLAGGKVAAQRGDYATAVEKWEALLKVPGLESQVERAVAPQLAEVRRKLARGEKTAPPPPVAPAVVPAAVPAVRAEAPVAGKAPAVAARQSDRVTVAGTVGGGGQLGPGGTVVWLRRLDGPMPRVAPASGQFITQREKTFIPHVLAVPVGTAVEIRNDDRIYHNVFSIAKANEFDAGIREPGTTFARKFDQSGPVEILCNIHANMNAYVYAVDSPFFTKARSSGAFSIRNVPPGRYEIAAWHEAATTVTRKRIVVPSEDPISITVGGDKRPAPFVPDKYGKKRQAHLGY